MNTRTLLVITVVLTVLVVADTGWVVYRMATGQPTEWWGMLLLIPWLWAMKKLTASMPGASGAPAEGSAQQG